MNDEVVATIDDKVTINEERLKSAKTIATIVYVLQAATLFLGITVIVAIIINYIKRPDVQGTYVESHFTWQIRTFWFGLLWAIIGAIASFVFVGIFILIAGGIWFLYRIIKGWLRLNDGKEMYGSG